MSVTVRHMELAVKVTHKRISSIQRTFMEKRIKCFPSFYLSSIPPFLLSVSCQCGPHSWFGLVSLCLRERQRGRVTHTVLLCLHMNHSVWQYYQPEFPVPWRYSTENIQNIWVHVSNHKMVSYGHLMPLSLHLQISRVRLFILFNFLITLYILI